MGCRVAGFLLVAVSHVFLDKASIAMKVTEVTTVMEEMVALVVTMVRVAVMVVVVAEVGVVQDVMMGRQIVLRIVGDDDEKPCRWRR